MPKRTCSRCGQFHKQDCLDLRYESKVDRLTTPDGCHPWVGQLGKPDGYGRIRNLLAHRFGWALLHGPIPPGMEVLHTCDNPPCCNPAHWRLGTHHENMLDMVAKGRQSRGEANPKSKLTAAQVLDIRARYAAGEAGQTDLAREFRVSAVSIHKIVHGQHWRHLS